MHLNETVSSVTCEGGQSGEDVILRELLPEVGTYIDIGASHPQECSNTWRLYQRGWRGLLIDPLPQSWYGLLRHRPGDLLFPVAAGNTDGTAMLREFHSVSSLRKEWPIEPRKEIEVDVMRLDSILKLFPDIEKKANLLSIDIEGFERQALEGNDWSRFVPYAVIIEYRWYGGESLGPDVSHEWKDILEGVGYKLHATTTFNQVWIRQ